MKQFWPKWSRANVKAKRPTALDRLHDQVRNGRRFADVLAETDLLPVLAVRMLRVGDETGDLPSIAAVAKAYRVYFKKVALDGGDYTMDHTAITYLMDKEGHFVSPFNLKRTPEGAAADLRRHL